MQAYASAGSSISLSMKQERPSDCIWVPPSIYGLVKTQKALTDPRETEGLIVAPIEGYVGWESLPSKHPGSFFLDILWALIVGDNPKPYVEPQNPLPKL